MTLNNVGLPIADWSGALPLHAPDGFFSLPISAAGYALAAAAVGFAIYRANRSLNERIVPMMGVMAAFIFAAQMLNFPVAGGTSGHLIGGALAAIILGPWAAILVMTAVVGLQALLFQDGGLLVMGVNLLNMSIVSVLAGYGTYWVSQRLGGGGYTSLMAGGFAAAWVSVVASSATTAVALSLSGTSPLAVALPAILGFHMLIGIGEGLITVFALSFIRQARPQLLGARPNAGADAVAVVASAVDGTRGRATLRGARLWAAGYVIAIALVMLAPFASGSPDGLERVAEDSGFMSAALSAPYSIISDYQLPGVQNEAVATALAGVVGVTVVYLLVAGCAYLLHRRRTGALQGQP